MLNRKERYAVCVAGATSAVGRELLELIEERGFPVSGLTLLASGESEGERIEVEGRSRTVTRLSDAAFAGSDIVFFATGVDEARQFGPAAAASGATVIDLSGAFLDDPNVPLVVPDVNAHAIAGNRSMLAVPDAVAAMLVLALNPLHQDAGITRITVTTFQSVSGEGKDGIDELAGQTVALLNFKDLEKRVYPHQVAFNCLPQVGAFREDGSTTEETRMATGTAKLLGIAATRIAATAVLVPVFRGIAAAVTVALEKKLQPNDVRALLSASPGVTVFDDTHKNLYPTPVDVVGKDEVWIGRVREDASVENGIALWIATDNLRTGAALTAIQIAEYLLRESGTGWSGHGTAQA